MIANIKDTIPSFFNFSFKSKILSGKIEKDICPLCLFFSEDFFELELSAVKIASFVKDYPYTSDVINGVVNFLIIILPNTENCKNFVKSNPFGEDTEAHRLSYLTKSGGPLYLFYDQDGIWTINEEGIILKEEVDEFKNEVKLYGIYNIFEQGNGILESGAGHHYVLQNKYHADKFIRTANILTKNCYIDFLAVFLLNFVSKEDKQIYIDTSGIISVVYAINKLKNIFNERFNPTILSFNSYEGVSNLKKDINTKIIISASTSGKLSKLITETSFSSDNINILFYLNEKKPEVSVLCNLIDFNPLNKKYSHFNIQKEADCTYCAKSSYPIKIVGEQFLPEELKVDTFTFDLNDRPVWLTKFIKQFFNKPGIITCFFKKAASDIKRDIYLDFKKILETPSSRLERYFASKLPNHIDILIFYDDEGSLYLRDLILQKYPNVNSIKAIEASEINTKKEELKNKNILIASSTITNGRRLVDTSLRLRDCDCSGLCYFVAISRSPDEYTLETTKKYIGFDNKFGREINPLIIVESIFISDTNISSTFSASDISSWEQEKLFLSENFNNDTFKDRINELLNESGLVNDLFLGDSQNVALRLRPNFAFFSGISGIKPENTTQAEVFFLINTILHNIRRNENKKLFQSAFHRHVISPEMFICYNDGIIQASILRSANPIELNYSLQGNNTRICTEMMNVLSYIFNNFDNEAGEGTIEFLIAICTKRMQLLSKELHVLINELKNKVSTSSIVNKDIVLGLCDYIIKNI